MLFLDHTAIILTMVVHSMLFHRKAFNGALSKFSNVYFLI